ncbi:MAG: hypothetical protein WDW38_002024 [Sanguina aurantia]
MDKLKHMIATALSTGDEKLSTNASTLSVFVGKWWRRDAEPALDKEEIGQNQRRTDLLALRNTERQDLAQVELERVVARQLQLPNEVQEATGRLADAKVTAASMFEPLSEQEVTGLNTRLQKLSAYQLLGVEALMLQQRDMATNSVDGAPLTLPAAQNIVLHPAMYDANEPPAVPDFSNYHVVTQRAIQILSLLCTSDRQANVDNAEQKVAALVGFEKWEADPSSSLAHTGIMSLASSRLGEAAEFCMQRLTLGPTEGSPSAEVAGGCTDSSAGRMLS